MTFSSEDIASRLDALNFENDAESIVDALYAFSYLSIYDEGKIYIATEETIYSAMCESLYFYEDGVEIPPSVEKMFMSAIRDVKEQISGRKARRVQQYEMMVGLF